VEQPWPLLATVAIVVVGKSLAAFVIVRAFGHDNRTALTISASLAQIGEFSFILAGLAVGLGLLPEAGRDLILASAIISIMLNPFLFAAVVRREKAAAARAAGSLPQAANDQLPTILTDHVIVVGFGRVGRIVAERLEAAEIAYLVIEADDAAGKRAVAAGAETHIGNAADPRVLSAAGLALARRVIVTIPDGFEAGGVVQEARRTNPAITIVTRAHSDAEIEHLTRLGADHAILGERELAQALLAGIHDDGDQPAAEPPAEGGRPILSDVEWALMAGVRELGIGANEAISRAALREAASALGDFSPARLAEGFAGLAEKNHLTPLGSERVRVTQTGFVAAQTAPTH
jgi:CPA2 family monovalent cation:H+ antiporter-2